MAVMGNLKVKISWDLSAVYAAVSIWEDLLYLTLWDHMFGGAE